MDLCPHAVEQCFLFTEIYVENTSPHTGHVRSIRRLVIYNSYKIFPMKSMGWVVMVDDLRYFNRSELSCPCCNQVKLAPDFGYALDSLRGAYGKAMALTSACRCEKHNTSVGGHPKSLHLMTGGHDTGGTCAVDVWMTDSEQRSKFVTTAQHQGWSVGVASSFLHLDLRGRFIGRRKVLFHYKR